MNRPKNNEYWSVKIDQIKAIRVTKDVGPLDEYVEGYIYEYGSGPDDLPEHSKIPLSFLSDKIE